MKELMMAMIDAAKGLGVHHNHLTSHSGRAANGLYRGLGFVRYETNSYRMVM